jgi:hypothetical protein
MRDKRGNRMTREWFVWRGVHQHLWGEMDLVILRSKVLSHGAKQQNLVVIWSQRERWLPVAADNLRPFKKCDSNPKQYWKDGCHPADSPCHILRRLRAKSTRQLCTKKWRGWMTHAMLGAIWADSYEVGYALPIIPGSYCHTCIPPSAEPPRRSFKT